MAFSYDLNGFDYNKQTRIVAGTDDGDARILSLNKYDSLLTTCFEEKTLYELFLRGLRLSSKLVKTFHSSYQIV